MPGKRDNLEKFFGIRSRTGWLFMVLAAVALAANWLAVVIFLASRPAGLPDFLRLHYTAALGVDWVAEWWKIFIYPGVGLAVFFINGFFSGILAKRHRMLGLLILGTTAVMEVLLTVAGFLAVMLNI